MTARADSIQRACTGILLLMSTTSMMSVQRGGVHLPNNAWMCNSEDEERGFRTTRLAVEKLRLNSRQLDKSPRCMSFGTYRTWCDSKPASAPHSSMSLQLSATGCQIGEESSVSLSRWKWRETAVDGETRVKLKFPLLTEARKY
jgi:hypothetical protein